MGWGISPGLAELAPIAMQWFYKESARTGGKDGFVAGPSGLGYFYPSQYPIARLREQVVALNRLMEESDLRVVQILDFHAFSRLDLWSLYTLQPAIQGLLYLEFAPYHGAKGQVVFTNGKPIIAAREVLWKGLCEEEELIGRLNRAERNPSSAQGYSLVAVHAWSKSLADIQKVVKGLAPEVEVLDPEAFVERVRFHLAPVPDRSRQLH